ncbi:hypothetical protein ACYPKM_04565 [Pseudomonas aeruginosa]
MDAPVVYQVDTYFDADLSQIEHLAKYRNLMPWVGPGYRDAGLKLLLLGESHYLPDGVTYHHDAASWYAGIQVTDPDHIKWMNTRGIIANGISKKWKGKSKTIYRNLTAALLDAGFPSDHPAFSQLAYMNFFQRPAEDTGDSIKVKEIDRQVSSSTVADVVKCLRPDLVVFCSKLAWRVASDIGLALKLQEIGITVGDTPHPASAWWNRASKKRGGRTGRQNFIELLQQCGSRAPTDPA